MITPRTNPVGIVGMAFVEFATADPAPLDQLFTAFGFSRLERHAGARVRHYAQNDIHFFLNTEPASFAAHFARLHGPSVSALGWAVHDPQEALRVAVGRGANAYSGELPYAGATAVFGVGESLIIFVAEGDRYRDDFIAADDRLHIDPKGFLGIDHLTNNVGRGQMDVWVRFYQHIFGFEEVRTFDIRGASTGLTSYALRSPCGTFCIPINEGSEERSQIEAFLREYHGAGVQHIALSTDDLLGSLAALDGCGVVTLDIDDDYYETVFDRVPGVLEDHDAIARRQVLVDGDDRGYLLQIFTENVIGPIFIEMIQRRNHHSFGEGNFGALFRSIERDQARRGEL